MAAAPAGGGDRRELALTFRVGGERFALPAADIAEVIRRPLTTRVPQAPASLVGLANLRGAVLPVISLAQLMGRERGAGVDGRVIIFDRGVRVGLLVDEVSALKDSAALAGGDAPVRLIDAHALVTEGYGATARRIVGAKPHDGAAPATASAAASDLILLTFVVGGQMFGLPLAQVEEVIKLPPAIAAVPHSDAAMLGAASHRDGLLSLLSLRVLLDLDGRGDAGDRPRVVVTRIGSAKVGLVVDALGLIERVPEEAIDPVPTVLTRGSAEAQIQAICRLHDGRQLVSILSADHLLNDDLAALLATDEGQREHPMDDNAMRDGSTEQIIVFQLGGDDYGLPIGSVDEVTRLPDKLTRLPRAPAFVEGVINLRGQVIPVIDQRRRFQAQAGDGRRQRVIIVHLGDLRAGFIVDSVSDVLRVPADALQPTPDLGNEATRIIDRAVTLDAGGRLILMVDPQMLLDRAERDLLAAMRTDGEAAAADT